MPVEIIGEFGTPGAEREWIVAECELAIKHMVKACGEPPPVESSHSEPLDFPARRRGNPDCGAEATAPR